MDKKSFLGQMNGIHGKSAVSAQSLNVNSVRGSDIHHIGVNGSLCPARVKSRRQRWEVKPSELAINTVNPIRAIVDGMKLTPHPDKPMISLSIGKKSFSDFIIIGDVNSF